MLEVRKRPPTTISALALLPHVVDGSYYGYRLASIEEYISTLDLQNPGEISLKQVISLSLKVMKMNVLLPLLFFLPREWKEPHLLSELIQQHPDMEHLLFGAFVKYISPMTLACIKDTTLGISPDSCEMEKEDRSDGISDSSIDGLVLPTNLRDRTSGSKDRIHLPDDGFEFSPMLPMLCSGDNKKDPVLPSLPNPFVLSRDMPVIVSKILMLRLFWLRNWRNYLEKIKRKRRYRVR